MLLPSCPVWSFCGPVNIVPVLPLFRVQSNWSPRGRLIHSQKPPSKSQVPEIPLKLWSNYSSILFSYSPHPSSFHPSVRLSSLFVFLSEPLFHECMHSLVNSPSFTFQVNQSVKQSITQSLIWCSSNVLLFIKINFLSIRLFKYAHVSVFLNFAC